MKLSSYHLYTIHFLRLLFVILVMISLNACSNKKNIISHRSIIKENNSNHFIIPTVPQSIHKLDKRINFIIKHYWDNYNFSDTTLIHKPNITNWGLVNFIKILSYINKKDAIKAINENLRMAQTDTTNNMYNHFLTLYKQYLCNYNSPIRNDELYIPVLENIIHDSTSSLESKSRANFNLTMTIKNRVGQAAADFHYILSSGEISNLYKISSAYTILVFYNPDCMICKENIKKMANSNIINIEIKNKLLEILAIFPESDLNLWRSHLKDFPSQWTNGYDANLEIENKRLYDLRAIPSFYLLDNNKKVILKDTDLETIESWLQTNQPIIYKNH